MHFFFRLYPPCIASLYLHHMDCDMNIVARTILATIAVVTLANVISAETLSGTQTERSVSLAASKSPWTIREQYFVPEGYELVVEAGVTLVFERGASLYAQGTLKMQGTGQKPIVCVGLEHEVGYWGGIITKGENTVIDHIIVSEAELGLNTCGGKPTIKNSIFRKNKQGVTAEGTPSFYNCIIADNNGDGIWKHGGGGDYAFFYNCSITNNVGWGFNGRYYASPMFSNCMITGNKGGGVHVFLYDCRMSASECSIFGNDGYDVYNDGGLVVDFTGNWWGEETTRILLERGDGVNLPNIRDGRDTNGGNIVLVGNYLTDAPKDCGARIVMENDSAEEEGEDNDAIIPWENGVEFELAIDASKLPGAVIGYLPMGTTVVFRYLRGTWTRWDGHDEYVNPDENWGRFDASRTILFTMADLTDDITDDDELVSIPKGTANAPFRFTVPANGLYCLRQFDSSISGVNDNAGVVTYGVTIFTSDHTIDDAGLSAITNVTARQRYPWTDIVDVSFKLDLPGGALARVSLSGEDLDKGAAMPATTISGDGADGALIGAGEHRMSWNVSRDYPGFSSEHFRISVDAEIFASTTYHVQIFVDDHDFIKISGNKLWIEHIARRLSSGYTVLPGYWGGNSSIGKDTLYINGVGWTPEWVGLENENPATNCISSIFSFPSGISPLRSTAYTLQTISARNTLRIAQQPTEGDGGILSVEINDPSSGQVEYEFNLVPQSGGEPTALDVIGGASNVFRFDTNFAIANVSARQRYPWNGKVDISYEVIGGALAEFTNGQQVARIKVSATDHTTGNVYEAMAISGDTSLSKGIHNLVWDMEADGLTFTSSSVVFTVSCETIPMNYCVIDLSDGPNASSYPIIYLAEPPSGGFNVDEYKTTKLVLKRIEAGTFIMGEDQADESHRVSLTKPFYMGLFEVTQKQYQLVTGSNPSNFSGDKRPVEKVSYNVIRGSSSGAQWPSSNAVDSSSFMGKLRSRTGLDFDLPTEAQWEYACRAGTTTTYSYGDSVNGNYMWYTDNSSSQTHDVGTNPPNGWGLYEMHGNVWEWCLDWYASSLGSGTDPKGPSSGSRRVPRGGSWFNDATSCASSYRNGIYPSRGSFDSGFRLALPAQIAIRAIHFSANGGTGSMNNVILVGAETVNLPPVNFVGPDGAAFLGWATNSDGLVEYLNGASMEGLSPTEEDVTLYAKWDRGSFNIRFDANGGTGNMADQTIPLDLPQALLDCAYEREGHVFTGWASEPEGGVIFTDGEIVINLADADSDVTLYAIWSEGAPGLAIKYYDTYDYGYPAFGRSESDMIAYFGSHESTLSTNSYDWGATLDAGYMEAGRFPEIEGLWREETMTNKYHGAYANRAKDYFAMALGGFIDIRKPGTYRFAASADDQIALYIDGMFICGNDQWDQLSYGETFLSSGLHRIEIGVYERDCDHGMFVAWMQPGDVSYTPIPQAMLSHRIGSDMLEFFPGDGEGQMSPIAVDRNFGALLPKCAFTKTGYSPAWAVEPNGNAAYADGCGVPPEITALYAVWSINQYTISFNANGGTDVSSITQNYGTSITAPDNPTRTGYTFRGWTPPVPATMPPNDTECIASWRANTYTIRFSENGGTGSMTDFRLAYDTTVTLPPVEYAGPNGAAFLGWATTPDGLVEYGDEATIRNLSSVAGDVITLYAKWNRGSFNVTFNANGGTGSMAQQTFAFDLPQQLLECAFERQDYYFCGWGTEPNGAVVFADGEKVANLIPSGGSVTLYAKWAYTPTNGLILCYDFDGETLTANDRSGKGNNGAVTGASWHRDNYGNGYFEFDGLPGLRDQVDRTPNDNHDFIRVEGNLADFPLNNFTISVVCCPQNGGTIIGSAQNELWQREWDLTYDRFQWAWEPGHSSGAVGRESLTLEFAGALDSIQHFIVKREGTRITVLRNGVVVSESENFPNLVLPCYSYGLFLGNMELDSGSWHRWDCMKGDIYNAAIWNRALSEDEIASLWHFTGNKYRIGETH